MIKLMKNRLATRRGMASLYLVAFTTLLMGIVSISFVEVMLNESRESVNSDLSQSAFDSALAGIEDAKNAIVLYNSCLNMDDGSSPANAPTKSDGSKMTCRMVRDAMLNGMQKNSCDTALNVLGKENTTGATDISVDGGENLGQAYTCVTITNDASDYRSTLNDGNRSRVIPVDSQDELGNADARIVAVELEWYSNTTFEDYLSSEYMYNLSDGISLWNEGVIPFLKKDTTVGAQGKEVTVPILAFEVFQTDNTFTMAQLDLNNEANNGTDHAMIVLYPENKEEDVHGTFVSARDLLDASNKSNQAALTVSNDKNSSIVPKLVSCGYKDGSRCRATIQLPATYSGNSTAYTGSPGRSKSTFLLRVSSPYGGAGTDFSIKLCTEISGESCSKRAQFDGVQYIVDSTGRANTLYRRITARIETTLSPIFPEYAVQVSGNENSIIEKNFYVTENCWSTDGKGNSSTCANNGDASTKFPQ